MSAKIHDAGGVARAQLAAQDRAPSRTFSEVMGAMKELAEAGGSRSERLSAYRALREQAAELGIDGPFKAQFASASFKTLRSIGGWQATKAVVDVLKTKLSGAPPRPVSNRRPAFDAAATGYAKVNAHLTAQSSMLAYEPDARIEAELGKQGFTNVDVLSDRLTSARGFVAERDDAVLVTLQGTADLIDVLKDARACLCDGDRYGGGKTHDGFDKQLDALWPSIRGAITDAHRRAPDKPVIFTGHSLGGALAVLALARAREEGLIPEASAGGRPPAQLYTYGQPRAGDDAFAKAFAERNADIPYVRTMHRRDPVAHVPPEGLCYKHPEATVVFHDDRGRTHVGIDDDDPRIPAPPQDLSIRQLCQLVKDTVAGVVDHNEVNYALVARRALDA